MRYAMPRPANVMRDRLRLIHAFGHGVLAAPAMWGHGRILQANGQPDHVRHLPRPLLQDLGSTLSRKHDAGI